MNGYLLFIFQEMYDRDALVEYWHGLDAALEGQDVEHVITYGAIDRLEGIGDFEAVQLLRFPSFDQAKAWYQSPAYQAIRPLAQKGARYLCTVMESGRWTQAKDRMPHTIGRAVKPA